MGTGWHSRYSGRLRAECPGSRGSIPNRGEGSLGYKHLRLGTGGSVLLGVKRPEHEADHLCSLQAVRVCVRTGYEISAYRKFVKVKVLPLQAAKALRAGRGTALANLRPRH